MMFLTRGKLSRHWQSHFMSEQLCFEEQCFSHARTVLTGRLSYGVGPYSGWTGSMTVLQLPLIIMMIVS
jgi:hypothetical protein